MPQKDDAPGTLAANPGAGEPDVESKLKSECTTSPSAGDKRFDCLPQVWPLRIGSTAYVVLGALSHHADAEGLCWPSATRLAELTSLDRTTVFRCLRQLEGGGWVRRSRQAGKVTRYRLNYTHSASATSGGDATSAGATSGAGATRPVALVLPPPVAPVPPEQDSVEQDSKNKTQGGTRDGSKGSHGSRGNGSARDEAPWGALPPSLDRADVLEALAEYDTHRRERRSKLTPTAWRRLLAKLDQFGPESAVAALNEAVEKGWLGAFPERVTANLPRSRTPSRPGYDPAAEFADEEGETFHNTGGLP